jgi:hypothetical protein
MPSPWRHALCAPCYEALEPGRNPVALRDAQVELCCRCGLLTVSGIYYRADPESLACKGVHRSASEDIHILLGMMGRWYFEKADAPGLAWSGSRWVPHYRGVPASSVQVANYARLDEATEEAGMRGFRVLVQKKPPRPSHAEPSHAEEE